MTKKILILLIFITSSCNFNTPTDFSKEAINENLYDLKGKSVLFKNVINKYKGKKILIDFWASWCADCIKGMPNVKKLQNDFPQVVFIFLSVDKNKSSWKNVVLKYKINGEHYNLPKGMKEGELVDFVGLSWIPRYMVIDKEGKIKLFKATKVTDKRIIEALKS